MSLNSALSIALAGLRANQSSMAMVSSNVANAETPGYVRKTVDQVQSNSGSVGSSVRIVGVNRHLDDYIQAQLRTETSGAAYASLRSDVLKQLQSMFGSPGAVGSLEHSFSALATALQGLSTSADNPDARLGVLNAASVMANQLNAMTAGVQSLRGAAETGIADSVHLANSLMQQISNINNRLQANPSGAGSLEPTSAAMLDHRDQLVTQLSQLMDIRVTSNSLNQVTIFTSSGVQLVGSEAAKLTFNAQGTVSANTEWNADPAKSLLGSIRVEYGDGGSYDLTGNGGIKSGAIAAYLELRDVTLVEAQKQLDGFASTMAKALTDVTEAAPIVTAGATTSTSIDITGMKPGNQISLSVTNTGTNQKTNYSIVFVDDLSVLPLSDNATAIAGDRVIGVYADPNNPNMASIVGQLNAALGGANIQFSNTGLNLEIQNSSPLMRLDSASSTKTATTTSLGTQSGGLQLELFQDSSKAYTGAITAGGSQSIGFAGRINVNTAIINDPSLLVKFNSTTLEGDSARATFVLNQLTKGSFTYHPSTGIGTDATPYKGSLLSFMQQFVGKQGALAENAASLSDGQDVVLNTLQNKLSKASGVDMDEEMAHLLSLQNAYSANARVLSTVNEMYKILMQAM